MPYQSTAQRGKFHELLKQGKISQAVVDEWDKASKGLVLPPHKNEATGPISRSIQARKEHFGRGRK